MKTIRTIIATLSAVLLAFALMAWFSVRRNAAFLQRTIYQGFDQTFVVALVMGCAFLLISVILTVAIVSTENEEAEEDEEEIVTPRKRPQPAAEHKPAAPKGEQPYRRVSRNRTMDRPEENGFARPKAEEQPKPKKRAQAAENPEDIAFRREEAPVKKAKKPAEPEKGARIAPARRPKPQPEEAEEDWAPMIVAQKPVTPEPAAPAVEPEPAEPAPAEAAEAPAPAPEEASEPVAAVEPEAVPAAEEPAEAPETLPAEPEEGPEAPEETPAEVEPPKEEPMVRCVFCGSSVPRGTQVCPHCGKKM
jgi:hypothetical protein